MLLNFQLVLLSFQLVTRNSSLVTLNSCFTISREKKLQEIIKDQQQFERDIEIERAPCSGKTMIDGSPNKRITIIAKLLTFKDKQEVLSDYNHLVSS